MLTFLGRGTKFSDECTSAYFITEDRELVIIDCPITAFSKLKELKLSNYMRVYVFVTSTHVESIGALSLFIQYMYCILKKFVKIVAPSSKVAKDIRTILDIEKIDPFWYELVVSLQLTDNKWLGETILIENSNDEHFGYRFFLEGFSTMESVLYTGITSTLEPFKPYLKGNESTIYMDVSKKYGINLEENISILKELIKCGINVSFIHIDMKHDEINMVLKKHGLIYAKDLVADNNFDSATNKKR